jgi:hypothetical protein
MKHGKVRERPKVESISGQKYKMIITFTNSKSANNALQDFPNSDLAEEYQRKNIALSLSYFHSKENKIYASGIKESDDRVIKEAFEVFGEISEFTTAKQKKNDLLTAVIGYVNEYFVCLTQNRLQKSVGFVYGITQSKGTLCEVTLRHHFHDHRREESVHRNEEKTEFVHPTSQAKPIHPNGICVDSVANVLSV